MLWLTVSSSVNVSFFIKLNYAVCGMMKEKFVIRAKMCRVERYEKIENSTSRRHW